MANQVEWKKALSFVDRLETIQRIANSLRRVPGDSQGDTANQARLKESEIYEHSNSRAEYDAASEAAIDIEHDETSQPSSSDEDDSSAPTTSTSIGEYTQATHHRDGLFSFVFKASSPTTSQTVALKVTTPSLMSAPHDSIREARILQSCKHPHTIPLLATFTQPGGRFILVFPFQPHDLSQLLSRPEPPTRAAVKSILHDLFTALAHLHTLGIIHRDIKPSNILLASPAGPAYLADFGIAWSPHDAASEPADAKITDVGTASYRPPELLFGHSGYGVALDLWAAGCVVAQAGDLSARPLFDSGDVGSELALVQSMFTSLGTPTLESWPEASTLPDWGKLAFRRFEPKSWSEMMPNAEDGARDLASRLLRFESGERLSADQALRHEYFSTHT